jgi:trigger factor
MLVKATVLEADYAPEVEKSLREYRRKANVPGFRPGMVPMGIINKMYRRGTVAEQAYRKANEAVFKYLEENRIDIMGDVMPSEEQKELNFDEGTTEHEFVFEVGVAPAVEVSVDEKDKLTHYNIKPDKDLREKYRASIPEGGVPEGQDVDKLIDERIDADLARESAFLLDMQFKNMLLAKANLRLPEAFLKRWLHAVNEGKFTMEEIEKDFPAFLRMMSWNLVQRYFAEKLDIKVEKEDMEAEAKTIARMQFAQYGMPDVPEETLAGFASSILANKEEAQRIYERVREGRILAALKPMVKIGEKSVTVEEFQKIASES